IRISNLPAGATLTAGTLVSPGVYDLTTAQLSGLGINLPHGLTGGSYTLNVQSVSHELNLSGSETDLLDNYAHADTTITLGVTATDSDGDTGAGTVHITVLDDAPHIDHVDDLLISNTSGLYTGNVAVSGIADGIDHFVLSALNGQVPAGLTYTVYAAGDALPA